MKLSIIVPAYNVEKTIQACLESIRNSDTKDYEIIVVDDGSEDQTREIAGRLADRVISHDNNRGLLATRESGMREAGGEILVFIDADVCIFKETLSLIEDYFLGNPSINALTGLLSKTHPNQNFFSQYKNLYMNYMFHKLPDRVSFFYGSIFALRRELKDVLSINYRPGEDKTVTEDLAYGQTLTSRSQQIAFLNNLAVIHLKKYSFLSWVKNDFNITHSWARIFIDFKGWRQLGRNRVGFAHSSKAQLASIIVGPASGFMAAISIYSKSTACIGWCGIFIWFILNAEFIIFLAKERGGLFGFLSIPVTYLDHLIMLSGIASGLTRQIISRRLA